MKVCEALKLAKSEFGTALAWEMLRFSQNKSREELFLSLDKPLETKRLSTKFSRVTKGANRLNTSPAKPSFSRGNFSLRAEF